MVLKAPVPPDPVFVGSAYLRESLPAGNPEGDDDKVYFFFSETGKEFDYFENTIVSRIARVCKVGAGQRGHTWGGCARHVADAGQGVGMWDHPAHVCPWEGTSTCGGALRGSYSSTVPSPAQACCPCLPHW